MKNKKAVALLLAFLSGKAFEQELNPKEHKLIVPSVGLAASFNGNIGYKPGIGVTGELKLRKGPVGADLFGSLSYEKKLKSYFGYTYDYGAALRLFPYKDFYLAAGHSTSGYESRFREHGPWKKESRGPFYEIGFDDDENSASASYFPSEDTSVNHVSAIRLEAAHRSGKFILKPKLSIIRYDQNGKRETGFGAEFSILWDFGKKTDKK